MTHDTTISLSGHNITITLPDHWPTNGGAVCKVLMAFAREKKNVHYNQMSELASRIIAAFRSGLSADDEPERVVTFAIKEIDAIDSHYVLGSTIQPRGQYIRDLLAK